MTRHGRPEPTSTPKSFTPSTGAKGIRRRSAPRRATRRPPRAAQPPSIATRVEHHHAIPAGDEEKIEGLIERQPFRSVVAAAGEPRRRDPPAPHVDAQRAILVLEVSEEDAAQVVDGEAFGLPVQG